jgi:hypothetical protein
MGLFQSYTHGRKVNRLTRVDFDLFFSLFIYIYIYIYYFHPSTLGCLVIKFIGLFNLFLIGLLRYHDQVTNWACYLGWARIILFTFYSLLVFF